LKVPYRSGFGAARPRHPHHPAVNLQTIAVRVEEVEGVAATAADEGFAALRAVHVGPADDLDAAVAHVIEREQPVLTRVDLESDVIDAGCRAMPRVDERNAGLLRVLGKLEQDDVVMFVVDAHEADRTAELRRAPVSGHLEAEHLAIKLDRAADVADMNADVPDPAEANGHGCPLCLRARTCRTGRSCSVIRRSEGAICRHHRAYGRHPAKYRSRIRR
jgi:hypothetical protein